MTKAANNSTAEVSWDYVRKCEDMRAEVERLRSLVKALADDLEDELKGHYSGTLDYPSERRRFERDMANVYEARKALEGK